MANLTRGRAADRARRGRSDTPLNAAPVAACAGLGLGASAGAAQAEAASPVPGETLLFRAGMPAPR